MDKKEKHEVLEELKDETRTIIIYEAPHRLVRTLKELLETYVKFCKGEAANPN